MAQNKTGSALTPEQIRQIQALAENIRYGSITLVFQDGILIQIERNEKIRLDKNRATPHNSGA